NYVATNAVIAPSLGRNLSTGANGTVTVNIAQPGTVYPNRASQLDLRLSKTFTVGHTRIQPLVDFFNVMNGNPVFQYNAAYGTTAGVGKDTTGAVLPGVTVEASSPALIEKVRTVVSDASGQYKVIDLRPGTYSVTFTLPGFSTVKRDGIELTAGFTATVNGELRVGRVEENVTVSGQSPVVDTQN